MKHLFKLSLLLLAVLLPATATAHDFEVDGIYYNINGNEATVTYKGPSSAQYDNEYSNSVTIPAIVTYDSTTYSVTSIGNEAFSACWDMTSITIPNSVTSIGNCAFDSCFGLTNLTLPNSVTTIGISAFYGCSGLTSLTLPNSLTSIGEWAFAYCRGLTSVTVPSSMTFISDQMFRDCSSLTTIDIPNSVTSIGIDAFGNCTSLSNIIIPNSVTSIGNDAFFGCRSLTSVTIPYSVITIGNSAFYGCTGLTSLSLPNSVKSIGNSAFDGCTGLTSVTIPNSVTSIGNKAFFMCDSLNDVYSYISDPSVITMGSNVFYRNPKNYDVRTLHVPNGSVAAYQADTNWSQYFGSIVEMGPDPVPAESIKLNVTTAGLNEGSILQLKATVLPEGASSESVLWASNNPSVATVDSNGLVTTHSVGTATITAMTTDGSNLSTTCTVTLLPVGVKGDTNGDIEVGIADVTALINYLLTGNW